MKEIILVYENDCIESKKALEFFKKVKTEYLKHRFKLIKLSNQEPLIKKLNVFITPTFIIDNEIFYIGTPDKKVFKSKLEMNLI